MIAVDTNILVYSHRASSQFHPAAKAAVESLRESERPWAIPWPCILEFIAITTHPKIYIPPSTLDEAFGAISSWLGGNNLHFLSESDGMFEKLREIATTAQIKGARIYDARIAAICLHHGVTELWTADRDFSAFPKLAVRNPLS
jgi:toxin-antitoxin system PIN domain toxin